MDNSQLTPRTPTPDEYLTLRAAAGLSPFSRAAAELALPNTIFAVVIEEAGRAIGMGRLIGDGGCFFQIVDIAVDPAFQGRGLGKRIMAGLMAHVATLPKGAYVSLIADTPADRLYAQFGFVATAPRSLGMAYRVK
jgi:ribosomal protein S18 acetylase RimI-like enzyme